MLKWELRLIGFIWMFKYSDLQALMLILGHDMNSDVNVF
jgi:hypothetical protein